MSSPPLGTFDSDLRPEIFNHADKLHTDDLAQQRYCTKAGYFQNICASSGDLGELVTGKKSGRARDRELAVALSLGLTLEDMATAILIYRAARKQQVGQVLPL